MKLKKLITPPPTEEPVPDDRGIFHYSTEHDYTVEILTGPQHKLTFGLSGMPLILSTYTKHRPVTLEQIQKQESFEKELEAIAVYAESLGCTTEEHNYQLAKLKQSLAILAFRPQGVEFRGWRYRVVKV